MTTTQDGYVERTAEVRHKDGLHMRPAMQFVDCANGYSAQIKVCKGEKCVDGKSIMQMTMLAATLGTQLKIIVQGQDAEQAVEELAKVIENETSEA